MGSLLGRRISLDNVKRFLTIEVSAQFTALLWRKKTRQETTDYWRNSEESLSGSIGAIYEVSPELTGSAN